MNSYTNMAAGALLSAVFVVMSVSIASEGLFHAEEPEKPGFAIVAEEAPAAVPIAQLLASADPAAGANSFKKCASCHSAEPSSPNKVGPGLWSVVNRPIAAHEAFSYSAAMKDFSKGGAEKWDYEHLNHFLAAPKAYIKGTAMGFAGLKNDQERANVIAYLRSLSDSPAPLPDPAAAPPATN